MAAFLRVELEDGRVVVALPGGSQLTEAERPEDLLEAVIACLRASNKARPARPKSLAITHSEEALHWLLALNEGRAS